MMKRFLIPFLAAFAFVGCSRDDVYPTAYEATIACLEWAAENKERSCKADSINTNGNATATPTMIGFEAREVIRRFKWSIR